MAKNPSQTISKEKHRLERDLKLTHHGIDPLEIAQLPKNDRVVFEALSRVGSATRSDLVKLCTLPRTTIYDALVRLERLGLVEQYFEERTSRGRPKVFYTLS